MNTRRKLLAWLSSMPLLGFCDTSHSALNNFGVEDEEGLVFKLEELGGTLMHRGADAVIVSIMKDGHLASYEWGVDRDIIGEHQKRWSDIYAQTAPK